MSFTIDQQLQASSVPVENMNMKLVGLYVQWHLEGKPMSPGKTELAKAAIALQEAYSKKDYYEVNEEVQWTSSDEEMFAKAISNFKGGNPHPILKAVRKEYLPRDKAEGGKVLIHCYFLNTRAVVEGTIAKIVEYPLGKGYVIEITKMIDHYLSSEQPRSKYLSLWVSGDPTATSGFVHI